MELECKAKDNFPGARASVASDFLCPCHIPQHNDESNPPLPSCAGFVPVAGCIFLIGSKGLGMFHNIRATSLSSRRLAVNLMPQVYPVPKISEGVNIWMGVRSGKKVENLPPSLTRSNFLGGEYFSPALA